MNRAKFATVVVALVAFAAVSFASPAHAEYAWEHYGFAPLAKTRAEAMTIRERAFREAMNLSDTCVKAAIMATNSPARAGHLNVGDRLAVMVSKGFEAHLDTRVAFKATQKGITPSANTEEWEFECDGQRHKIALPEVCYNWSLYPPVAAPPPTPPMVRKARVGPMPSGPATPQFRIMVSLFADRPDHLFRERYIVAKQTPSKLTAYKRAVLDFGHKALVEERRARPLAGGTFHLFVFDEQSNQIATDQLITDARGQALYKMPAQFASVRVVPDHSLHDVIPQEGVINTTTEQFQVVWRDWGSSTAEIFYIQAEGLDRPAK